MKVYIRERPETSQNGGIARVVEAQYKYLPEFGIELVDQPDQAELTVAHVMNVPFQPNTPAIVHNHGMMWSEYFDEDWAHNVNKRIVETIIQCQAYTVPSQWVRNAMVRGLLFDPQVIYHGVDVDEWQPIGSGVSAADRYVFWNKARVDAVSNPDDMNRVANLCRDILFKSTFGQFAPNVEIIGNRPNSEMRHLVQYASAYLATARETMGIGTLEALSSGVPVVGWDYGGQSEIVIQGETGLLVPYGDYQALEQCLREVFDDYRRYCKNARQDAIERWQWKDKIEQYARLYKSTVAWFNAPRPKVSVVVPAHNYAHYLPNALDSILAQTLQDFECIIVDDSSEDNTPKIAREYVEKDIRFRYHRTHYNMGLSAVRNYGAQKALGKYITYLDADDMLTPNSLAIQSQALDEHRELHIVYGSLDLMDREGNNRRRNSFPQHFNWYAQMAHQNQVPTGAMMRRAVIEYSGGWRERQWRAEDAEFWARVTSFGFRAAKVTDETTLLYRLHSDSKGMHEWNTYPDKDGNWLANIAWHSANTAQEGRDFLEQWGNRVPREDLVPFGAQGLPESKFWSVWHRQEPLVTVIIHGEGNIVDALDSLLGQTMDSWEAIVVGEFIPHLPYAKFTETIEQAEQMMRGTFKVTLFAGDMLPSDALWKYIEYQDSPITKDYLAKHQQQPTAPSNGKVLMRYIGLNRGEKPIKVRGKTYRVAQNKTYWVEPAEVPLLENMRFERVNQPLQVPEPSMADQRKVA